MKTLILIDGHSLAYRAYFALFTTQMQTSAKTPTWAVYGFFSALFSLLREIKPDAIAISFDLSRESFRTRIYPEYKANRESMPDDMKAQMTLIREGVEKLGIPIYEVPDFEADDVIGTLSRQAADEGFRVEILTGDQDAFQLVENGKVQVMIPSRSVKDGLKSFDRDAVFAKMGVYPEQVVDFKALKGDTSDNIPGVPGIGDKTAAKLLAEYQSVDNLYAHLNELPANKLKEKLETHKDLAFLSRTLATIDRKVPIDIKIEDCHLSIPDVKAFMEFLNTCEFRNFTKQAPSLLAPFLNGGGANGSSGGDGAEAQAEALSVEALEEQFSGRVKFPYTVIRDSAQLNNLLDTLKTAGIFALDIETTGLDVHGDKLVGIALAVFDPALGKPFEACKRKAKNILNLKEYPAEFDAICLSGRPDARSEKNIQSFYIPMAHQDDSPQLSQSDVLKELSPLLIDPALIKIVHNAKFELNLFRQLGIEWQGLVFDTMIASYVENPERRHGLKSLAAEIFGDTMQEIEELIGKGKKQVTFDEVPVDKAASYAACDAYETLRLCVYFLEKMSQDNANDDALTLFYEIEMPLAHVLAQMEWDGVCLDTRYLQTLSEDLARQIEKIETEIHQLAGEAFNINSPKQVGDLLFEKLEIQPLKKTAKKTGYSTDAKVLEQLADEHEIVQKILDYRQLFKLKSTYVDALPTLVNPKTRRVHTSFNQTITATGRLSSSGPNLQNIPIRSEVGRQIRQAFVPGEKSGWVLLSADYSQIELRLLAHFSNDPNLLKAFGEGADIHTATAALVFGMPLEKVTKEQRYKAKAVNFGVIYGQTAHGLSQQLKIPRYEAQEFIDRYFTLYKKVKTFIEITKQEAHKTGKVKTLCGRVRDLSSGLANENRNIREFSERAAVNTPLQGTAADLMKIAMIRVARKLVEKKLRSRMLLQVHDELVLEVPQEELETVKALVVDAMNLDQPLAVPLVIDVEVGKNWME